MQNNSMKEILYKLFEHNSLDRKEARDVMSNIASGLYPESQLAAFMTVFLMRPITTQELAGFRDAILERRVNIDLKAYNALDIVGTGGDGKNTFNVSTCACFVVAGTGYKVVKHGNYGASSVSGASNVLEMHGVKFSADTDKLRRSLEESNMAYLHAPLFSPALKSVSGVRKSLGVRTFFNMLGPLVNPVMPHSQLLGVYNLKLARAYKYLFEESGQNFTIVNSLDGYDEVSLTSEFKVFSNLSEDIYTPEQFGFKRAQQKALYGGDTPQKAAKIFDMVLSGQAAEEQSNAVLINAAFGLLTLEPSMGVDSAISLARDSLKSGRAKNAFEKFVYLNS